MSRIAKGTALAVAGAALAGAGYTFGHVSVPAGPRPCFIAAGSQGTGPGAARFRDAQLPSGDAARFGPADTRVCTDGTWVPVTGYGQ